MAGGNGKKRKKDIAKAATPNKKEKSPEEGTTKTKKL